MLLSLSIALALSQTEAPPLERIVVTGARPLNTIELVKDPKAPQQPLPAQDGADYLKAIPGFNLIRKGGTVLFERKSYQFDPEASPGQISTVIGSFGRIDGNADYLTGNENGFWRINASYSESDDYQDGNDTSINSAYQRWGVDTQFGWTPDQDTVVLLTLG